ncbi:unnamed protein product [Coregonus sp. 'balchen']|nr:unnamed protein product [Coregonus sp. 'balchen']
MSEAVDTSTLCLFDVDGTLTAARQQQCTNVFQRVTPGMEDLLQRLRRRVRVGVVGGSDFIKIKEQLGDDGVCLCVGVKVCLCEGVKVCLVCEGVKYYRRYMGEDLIKRLHQLCLNYLSKITLPRKRDVSIGDFSIGLPYGESLWIEPLTSNPKDFSLGELTYNPLTSNTNDFLYRERPINPDLLNPKDFSIGWSISFDVFPKGAGTSVICLGLVEKDSYKTIHFFGDKTKPGGNDYEIYADPRTIGHEVTCPEDTQRICQDLFFH